VLAVAAIARSAAADCDWFATAVASGKLLTWATVKAISEDDTWSSGLTLLASELFRLEADTLAVLELLTTREAITTIIKKFAKTIADFFSRFEALSRCKLGIASKRRPRLSAAIDLFSGEAVD
jgi:hypothetical protein